MWLAEREPASGIPLPCDDLKAKSDKKPVFMEKAISKTFQYRTRASTSGCILENEKISSDISKESFLIKSTRMWNRLPPHVKQAETLQKFKWKLKGWIKENVPQ